MEVRMFLKILFMGISIVSLTTAHKGYRLFFFGPHQHANGSALSHLIKSGAMMTIGWLIFTLSVSIVFGFI